jgi:hypothetical protein
MVRADESNDHDAGFVVGVAPRVTCAILNHRVARPKLAFCAVIELEHAAPGHNELIINRRSPVHSGIIWFQVLGKTGEFLIQLVYHRFHVRVFYQRRVRRYCVQSEPKPANWREVGVVGRRRAIVGESARCI